VFWNEKAEATAAAVSEWRGTGFIKKSEGFLLKEFVYICELGVGSSFATSWSRIPRSNQIFKLKIYWFLHKGSSTVANTWYDFVFLIMFSYHFWFAFTLLFLVIWFSSLSWIALIADMSKLFIFRSLMGWTLFLPLMLVPDWVGMRN
jgi:hypothetical protein